MGADSIESGRQTQKNRKEPTAVKKPYQIVTCAALESTLIVAQF